MTRILRLTHWYALEPLRMRVWHASTFELYLVPVPVLMESLPHRIDPVVCLATVAAYLLCFFVLSPLLVNSTARKHLRRSRQYQLLGHFVYSVVTSYLTVHIVVSGNMVKEAKSSLGFLTVEISFSYFVTETVTTLFVLRNTISGERMEFMHHIAGSVGLLVGVYCQGASLALCILRLFSQLSIPFLVTRVWLRGSGMKETGVYLVNFTVIVVIFFISRIVIIPWYWRLYIYWVLAPESSLLPCAILGVVSVVLDILNIYWFYGIIVKLLEYVEMMGERKNIPVIKL